MFNLADERTCKSVLGVSFAELLRIVAHFEPAYTDYLNSQCPNRRRRRGGGRKGAFPTAMHKVHFCLYYLKNYPTFDVLAQHFGIVRSTAHEALHKMLPILKNTLDALGIIPMTTVDDPEAFKAHLEKKTQLP